MAVFAAWALALIILASIVAAAVLLFVVLKVWAKSAYERLLVSPPTHCHIDAFVNPTKNPINPLKVVLGHKLSIGDRKASLEPLSLDCFESPHVPGLLVTRKSGTCDETAKNIQPLSQVLNLSTASPIVVATIRMGFGHHRLAYSACSWALKTGRTTIFHDLIAIQSKEADLIKNTDAMYSKFSRWASEMGGPIEKLWGAAMLSGDANALRMAALTAAHLQPLLLAFPKDTPIVTTHQLVALTASAAGFTNVVNLVVDNHPQWFLTVPNTINLCQGPANYESFRRMGISAKELHWAGHWCPAQLVENIPADCQRRIERAAAKQPIRILVPVGGAGAQRKFIINLVKASAGLVKQGKIQLLLNAGDHAHMKTAFLQVLDECGVSFETVTNTEGVFDFQKSLLDGKKEPKANVTLFTFDEYFPAVATTDILSRVADVLACKPSELAFYCIPKLHIRRVGDHEADSAKRASELGDGTLEAREIEDAMQFINLFLEEPDLLTSMNESIIKNNKIQIYDGCKVAVDLVTNKK